MEQQGERAWKPRSRDRHVSPALQAYAAMTTSADRGAVRDVTQLAPRPPRPPKASAAE
jgi:dihydroxy-acid dehydratase